MAKLKDIRGTGIQFLDADPVVYAGSWSSKAAMNTGRKGLSGFGTAAASIAATGNTPSTVTNCESWNGSAWSEVNDVNTGKFYRGNNGTATAGLLIGGAPSTGDVEEWDGTNWTETANYPGNVTGLIQLGTQTAAFCIGGDVPPYTTATNTYNGSSFTSSTAINTARSSGIGSGLTTAAVIAGGSTPSATGATELWNGSAWTEVNDLNTARDLLAGSGSSSTNSLAFGGLSTAVTSTESWNGTVWTEVNDLGTGRRELGGSTNGSNTSALAFGGCTSPGAVQTATEEWAFPPSTSSALIEGQMWFNSTSSTLKAYGSGAAPTGTFASGGNLTVAKNAAAGAGTQSAGIFMGGRLGPPPNAAVNQTELYNGSTWTEVNNLTTARYALGGANAGSQTATLAFGGYADSPAGNKAFTESWDGTNWTEVNDLNTAGSNGAGFGTQTAAIFAGGDDRTYNKTESWDGTNWTETTDLNTARAQMAGFGISTAGLVVGGDLYPVTSPTRLSVQTELWNGSAWTEVNDLNTGRRRIGNGGFGTQTSGLTAGGYTTTYVANTESWNGTSWAEQTEIQTKDNTTGIGAGAPSGLIAGGGTSPGAMSNATEEWTVDNKILTVTTS
jgi:hypothetical protein